MGTHIEKKHLDNIFNMRQTGGKGWYATDCPFCSKKGHMGINFTGVGSFNCFKCGERGTIYKLLKHINRLDVLREAKTIYVDNELVNKLNAETTVEKYEAMKRCSKPLGFKRIYDCEYIEGDRNIGSFVFDIHEIGYARLETHLKNYVIFLMYYENALIGWIGRSMLSNDEIKKIEAKTERRYLRYLNSPGTDFSKYLFGINEINEKTHTIILVEGIFDKLKVDTLLELNETDEIKCLACFGKKISKNQINLLRTKKNVSDIIMLYDLDAINEEKRYGIELDNYFNVKIGLCKSKDPGEMEKAELMEILENLSNPMDFFISKVQKIKLT